MFVMIPMAQTVLLKKTEPGIATSTQTHVSLNSSTIQVISCIVHQVYDSIAPVDHSRVILQMPDESGSDYINASYIEVGAATSQQCGHTTDNITL